MKKKTLRLMALAMTLTTGFSLTGCEEGTNINPTNPESIYALAAENGYTGTYEDWVKLLKGEKGDTGTQGPKGDTGEKGDKGDAGEAGPKGDTGDKGDKGDKGDVGEAGAQGPKGDTGEKGDKGDAGEAGPKGDTGDKGDKGDDGISIVKIEKTSSEDGVDTYTITFSDNTTSTYQVTNGKDGKDASVSISEDGYWVINGSKTDVPVTGNKGDKGDSGENGKDGKDGTSWHTGEGSPDSSLNAKEGDFYFDTESGFIYKYQKSEWVIIYQLAKNTDYTFTVTLDLNGGVYDGETTFTVPYGGFIENLPEPVKFGYEFVGFYTGLSKNDMKFTPYTPVYRDMNLIAVYEDETTKEEIIQRKYDLYNSLRQLTSDYKDMSEEQKSIFTDYIKRLENAKTYEEVKTIGNECSDWMQREFNSWKKQLKNEINSRIKEIEKFSPDYIPYFQSVYDKIDNWDDSFESERHYVSDIFNILTGLAQNQKALKESGVFQDEFEDVVNYIQYIKQDINNSQKTIQASDEYTAAISYFDKYNADSTIEEFLTNIVFVLNYIPEHITELDLNNPASVKAYLEEQMKSLKSKNYYNDYESILNRIIKLITTDSSEEECRMISNEFSIASRLCEDYDPDSFDDMVRKFFDWYSYDASSIRFNAENIEYLLSKNSNEGKKITNLIYMTDMLDIQEYLNENKTPDAKYGISNQLLQYFVNDSGFTAEKFQSVKSYVDSYLTRSYKFNFSPSTHELDLLSVLTEGDINKDVIDENTKKEWINIADEYKATLESNDYYLNDEKSAEYQKLYEALLKTTEETTLKEFLDNFDKAVDYLFENSAENTEKKLETWKQNAKSSLTEQFKTSDMEGVPEEYSYDFTDTKAFNDFISKIDAITTMEDFEKLATDQESSLVLMKACCKEKKDDAKKMLQFLFDNNSSQFNDEERLTYETALKQFKETSEDSYIDTMIDTFYKAILRWSSSSTTM